MGKLRDKMERDLTINGYSQLTIKQYLMHVKNLAGYFNHSPELLSIDDINRYQEYVLIEREMSWSYYNQCVCAIRFFYKFTLRRSWVIEFIPYHRKPRKLPDILSKEELYRLFCVVDSVRNKTILYALYSAGLRVSELTHLKVNDIDSDRMMIRVQEGKGKKDRYVMLSPVFLDILKVYWKSCRIKPTKYLFPGMKKDKPLHPRSVNLFLKQYVDKAEITKKITCHSFRHAFATHLLEDGVNIRIIQVLLGHSSIRSTEIYTRVSNTHIQTFSSPLDSLFISRKEAVHE